ncbi:Hsp20/alpha crystallin family protein [Salidesulfovibrio brasiliensis]|uniref:Hsp20/alpha crystallin family protein n=1 Tax=Salidesulfovibrio brasiliensis TaxID=221711 RepID=UPI0006CF940B|nr:Hsp20/alpha crystallin family protein [Salidesulfovibrio brasiliensis]
MVLDFNTFHPLPQLEKMFEEFMRPGYGSGKAMGYPPLNLSNDEENVYVRAEIPGVSLDEIELTLTDKTLVIKGERKKLAGKFLRQERPTGVFHRVIGLNVPVDRDKVAASMKDGILTVTLPKSEASRPKRIRIGAE